MFYEARQAVLDADYGVTEADIDSAWRKAQSGEKMNEAEALAYDELTAKMVAEVLGNEVSIRRMASKAPKLARSMLRRIGDLIDSLRGSNASKEELRRLRKAEQLFEDALAEIKETKESALKDYQKAEKALYKQAGAARRGYERDRKEYRKLKGTVTQEELDAWLRAHDYTEEDFADDVLEGDIEGGELVADFIDEVNQMVDASKRSKRKKRIGVISKKHAEIINDLMRVLNPNLNVEGYELWIDGTSANHIEVRHGKDGEADQTMATREAKSLIPWAAQNADTGSFILTKDGNIKMSDRFLNSDGSKAPEIRLEKNINDDIVYVSECVPDSTNKRIYITSAYIKKVARVNC